jgi:hypothetical protein
MSSVQKLGRRAFLKATGLAGAALALGVHVPWTAGCAVGEDELASFSPNLFVTLDS